MDSPDRIRDGFVLGTPVARGGPQSSAGRGHTSHLPADRAREEFSTRSRQMIRARSSPGVLQGPAFPRKGHMPTGTGRICTGAIGARATARPVRTDSHRAGDTRCLHPVFQYCASRDCVFFLTLRLRRMRGEHHGTVVGAAGTPIGKDNAGDGRAIWDGKTKS